MRQNNFIDLFSGAGGLLRGFLDAGYNAEFSVEVWKPALDTHRKNYPQVPLWDRDIRTITNEEISEYAGKVDVIVGGPPCQGFSTIGKRLVKDPRNELVFEYARFIEVIRPKVFVMENVRGLLSANKGVIKDAIASEFDSLGYNVTYKVVCAADYGVPQMRYRVIFIGIRKDLGTIPEFPQPTNTPDNYTTVGPAIMDLIGKENSFPNHIPMKHNSIVRGNWKSQEILRHPKETNRV